eukprot:1193335-Prorocentrum_minimum.AAC.1
MEGRSICIARLPQQPRWSACARGRCGGSTSGGREATGGCGQQANLPRAADISLDNKGKRPGDAGSRQTFREPLTSH